MKKSSLIICIGCFVLSSCGCGFNFLYNWRPKPWTHLYVENNYTGIDTLIAVGGYYLSQHTDSVDSKKDTLQTIHTDLIIPEFNKEFHSIMFYTNGLCVSLNTRITFSNVSEFIPTLDTLYSSLDFTNKNKSVFFEINNTSWGTYEIHKDTIKAFLIENLSGCEGIRKNIVTDTYVVSGKGELNKIYTSNSNKQYGYKDSLNIPSSTFYSVVEKRDSTECPYLENKWFYKKDATKNSTP